MPAEITSQQNALIKETRALGLQRKEREARGLAVAEGVRLVEEAAAAKAAVDWFLYTPELAGRERGAALVQALMGLGARGYQVPENVLAKAAGTESPQGIVAVWSPRAWTWEDLKSGPLLLCDGLQDPGNLGTVIRTAEAMGSGGVLLTGEGVDPYNPKVIRSAMGSLFRLPVIATAEPEQAADRLSGRGIRVVVAEAEGAFLPWQIDLAGPVALVIGSEAHGPSPALVATADATVRIPMPGRVESLNAAVAASLLLYESVRQRMRT